MIPHVGLPLATRVAATATAVPVVAGIAPIPLACGLQLRTLVRFAWLLLAAACSSPITVPDGRVEQLTFRASFFGAWSPALVVFVVDDGSSTAAQSARDLVTVPGLDTNLEFLWKGWRGGAVTPVDDPAFGFGTDIRVFIVHPSASLGQRLVGPLDDARLAVTSSSVVQSDLDALEQSIVTHVREGIVAQEASYPLLESMNDAVSLLTRERAPRDARELEIEASLPDTWTSTAVIVLTSRDDASPLPATAYIPPQSQSWQVQYAVEYVPCWTANEAAFPVLTAWEHAARQNVVQLFVAPANCNTPIDFCNARQAEYGWFGPLRPIATAGAGNACVITFSSHAECDASRGWADPVNESGAATGDRRCEILQLDGAALDGCKNTLACTGCTPGWCITNVPELQTVASRPSFRFVGRAAPVDVGYGGQITCNVQ